MPTFRAGLICAILCGISLALSGCGNAAAEQKAFREIKSKGGKINLRGSGPEITFFDVKITDDDLECLRPLKRVHAITLEFVPITDKGLEHILALEGINILKLKKTNVTDAGVQQLKAKFPDIVITVQ